MGLIFSSDDISNTVKDLIRNPFMYSIVFIEIVLLRSKTNRVLGPRPHPRLPRRGGHPRPGVRRPGGPILLEYLVPEPHPIRLPSPKHPHTPTLPEADAPRLIHNS